MCDEIHRLYWSSPVPSLYAGQLSRLSLHNFIITTLVILLLFLVITPIQQPNLSSELLLFLITIRLSNTLILSQILTFGASTSTQREIILVVTLGSKCLKNGRLGKLNVSSHLFSSLL